MTKRHHSDCHLSTHMHQTWCQDIQVACRYECTCPPSPITPLQAQARKVLDEINHYLGSNGGFEKCLGLLIAFAATVREEERERCAAMAESFRIGGTQPAQHQAMAAYDIAAALRAGMP